MDLLYNELSFNSSSMRFCEDAWWYRTYWYFNLSMKVGFNVC
jgi:hypothetical protein